MAATMNIPCDDSALDPIIKAHISTLYAAVDKMETVPFWASHFTKDAVLKKGANRIKGREALQAQVEKGWEPLEARKHTVYGVFPYGKERDEIMLDGRSENKYKSGEETTFTWAARMHFTRMEGGKVEIDEYTIIVDTEP